MANSMVFFGRVGDRLVLLTYDLRYMLHQILRLYRQFAVHPVPEDWELREVFQSQMRRVFATNPEETWCFWIC